MNFYEDIKIYQKKFAGNNKAIDSFRTQLNSISEKIQINRNQIDEIERSKTSVLPTINKINDILKKFQFSSFRLKHNSDSLGDYKIVRPDGSDARDLSEGENNFITFLYFYHLIYGAQVVDDMSKEKVVVIDDPISSLDSNVLFIVSTLVKNIISDCRKGKHGIVQFISMTHNVYYHKEITYQGSRDCYKRDEVLFGVIRKDNNVSTYKEYEKNPIQTTYQILWEELRSDKVSVASSFNSMRRILEYYFNTIGGLNYEKCISEFEGNDKIICKALISCINDGSHYINDDFMILFTAEDMESNLRVFRAIFEKMNHIDHYNMMMKISKDDQDS